MLKMGELAAQDGYAYNDLGIPIGADRIEDPPYRPPKGWTMGALAQQALYQPVTEPWAKLDRYNALPDAGPPAIDIGGGRTLAKDIRDDTALAELFVPTEPWELGAIAAFGPAGKVLGKAGKAAVLGGGVAAGSDDAEAGIISRASRIMGDIAAGDTRASTRLPTAVKAVEDPLRQHLSIGVEEMKLDPENFAFNAALASRYPGFERLKDMPAGDAAQAYVRQAADNLLYLYDRSPADIRLRSPRWYEGANEISDALANRWGVPRQSASANLAALSPQKDWFMNASLGERVGDILTMNPKVNDDMLRWVQRDPKLAKQYADDIREALGKPLDKVDSDTAAVAVRAYDELYNSPAYRSILPEGYFGDFIKTQKGENAKRAWGTFDSIGKAVDAMRSGGNMDVISPLLGTKHKVRSFYNNIEVPYDTRFGDITADTHQVAAAQMRPLSGASEAVIHNLASGGPAGSVNPRSSAVSGVQGTYGMTADATRLAAQEAGLLPRAMQSATWEPIRELFPADWKTAKNAAAVDDIWKAYDRGEISINRARDQIFELAGGIGTPEWARQGIGAFDPRLGSTYR